MEGIAPPASVVPITVTPRKRAIFLDRDGVINQSKIIDGKPYPPKSLADLVILPGVDEALARLRYAGFALVVVTNQPDVARGTQTRAVVDTLNRALNETLRFDAIEVCYHSDRDGCSCRKPQPGLLTAAADRDGIDLTTSYMVGDRWRDIDAGNAAGCTSILIGDGYREGLRSRPAVSVGSLAAAAVWILERESA